MEAIWIVLLVPVLIVLAIVIDARRTLFSRRLQRVAASMEGKFVKGGALRPPIIRFSIGRVPALAAFWAGLERLEPVGAVQARWTGQDVVEVQHKYWGNRIGGPPRVTVGDPAFEERFWIFAKGSAALVDAPLRRALDRLAVMGKVRASFRPGMVEVSVAAEDWDDFTIRQFITLACDAVRPALGPAAAETGGIEWVEDASPEPLTCPMCAGPLEASVVRCRRCRAPHHADCWSYGGRCAAFACGCVRFTKEGSS